MLVPMTLADSRHVTTLTELSASGVGDYSDPQKLKLIISDAFTEQMMQWTDMLTKADCNVGPHTQTRTLVREAFGTITEMLERYTAAGEDLLCRGMLQRSIALVPALGAAQVQYAGTYRNK